MKAQKLGALMMLLAPFAANAETTWFEKNYVVVAPQYADVEVGLADSSEAGFTIGFGTQIHPKWYLEAGYSLISDDFAVNESELDNSVALTNDVSSGVDASGIYLSFLGKASGPSGELFYKVGVMSIDYEAGFWTSDNDSCNLDDAILKIVNAISFCSYDDSSIAGMVGAGYDFYLGYNTQLRVNYEHIRGGNDFEANTAYLGFRYNF